MTEGELTKSLGDDALRCRITEDVMSLAKDLEHENFTGKSYMEMKRNMRMHDFVK